MPVTAEWSSISVPDPGGEAYGLAVGDLDRNGTMDGYTGVATVEGIVGGGTIHLNGTPAANQLLFNDGFATMTDFSGLIVPNTPAITLDVLAADYDNDGDLDLFEFNALSNSVIYKSTVFNEPPDLTTDQDPTMFYESTQTSLPPIWSITSVPPYDIQAFGSGQSLNTVVGDFNSDQRGETDTLLTLILS